MKNFYLLFVCIFSFQSSFATHIIGGSITYESLGNNEYKITLEVLRDCFNGNPNAYFDDPANIGIFDDNNELFQAIQIPLDFSTIDTVSILSANNVCIFPATICVHKAVYDTTISLPTSSGGFTIAYQRCCRSMVIANLIDPLNVGMTFQAFIDTNQENNSAQFNKDFPFAVFANTPFIYDGSATDLDGDSLVYELSTPFNGASPDNPFPDIPSAPPYEPLAFVDPPYSLTNMLGGDYPLNIDINTGEMTAIPQSLGVFQIGYSIKEYRDQQHISTIYREFAFVVVAPEPDQSYNVSGQVLVDDLTPLDLGTVQLLQRDITNDSIYLFEEQSITTEGTYAFTNIPPGVFYTKAVLDTASAYYDQFIPTYYDSAPFWYEADWVNQCDTSQVNRDIYLIHVDSLDGLIELDGVVNFAAPDSDPVPGLSLILVDATFAPIQLRNTNENGYFKFEGLPPGNYYVYVDLINSNIDNSNPPQLSLNSDKTVELVLFDDYLSLLSTSVSEPELQTDAFSVAIFPNPVLENCTLSLESKSPAIFDIQLYNIQGQLTNTISKELRIEGDWTVEIDTQDLAKGIYLLKIESGLGTKCLKVIKH